MVIEIKRKHPNPTLETATEKNYTTNDFCSTEPNFVSSVHTIGSKILHEYLNAKYQTKFAIKYLPYFFYFWLCIFIISALLDK